MADSVGKDDESASIPALNPKRAAETTAADDVLEKKRKLKGGDCRKCGKATDELTDCLCFGSDEGGVSLCHQCCAKKDHVTKCAKCKHLICLADPSNYEFEEEECCRGMEMCDLCGYDPDLPGEENCGAAICATCYKGSGWNKCFCSKVKFCPSCSLSGNQTYQHCNICKTLYCSDESGDCGRECLKCMQMLCAKCLGVSDPRSLNYCAGCHAEPNRRGRGIIGGYLNDYGESEERGSSGDERDSDSERGSDY